MVSKGLRIALAAFGAAFVLISVFTVLMANWNLGILFTFLAGGAMLVYGLLFHTINRHMAHGFWRWVRYILYAGFFGLLGMVIFLAAYGHMDNATGGEDAIIVLGAAVHGEEVSLPLAYRLDRAAEYWRQNPAAVIVVTGGQGFQEHVSEAEAMARYLQRLGIPQEKILKEEQATSTYENFQYSKAVLDQYFQTDYTVVLVTNHFHIYRAAQLAKRAGLNVRHVHADLLWYTLPPNYLRECAAVIKFWIFGN